MAQIRSWAKVVFNCEDVDFYGTGGPQSYIFRSIRIAHNCFNKLVFLKQVGFVHNFLFKIAMKTTKVCLFHRFFTCFFGNKYTYLRKKMKIGEKDFTDLNEGSLLMLGKRLFRV